MIISKIDTNIINGIRRIFQETRLQAELQNYNLQLIENLICQALRHEYIVTPIPKMVGIFLLYHPNTKKYTILDFRYSENKRNNLISTTQSRNLYDIINNSSEDVNVLIMLVYEALHIDSIYYLTQSNHNIYSVVDLLNDKNIRNSFRENSSRKTTGIYAKKISPAYYIGDDETNNCFIKQIKIKNYKYFSDEKIFYFKDRFSVLIGDNSSGKTSLLDAIRASLKSLLSNMGNKRNTSEQHTERMLKKAKKHRIEFDSTPIIRLNDIHQCVQENSHPTDCHCYIKSMNDWTEWTHEKKANTKRFRRLKSTQAIDYAIDLYELTNYENNKQVILPMFAYYGIHRTYDKYNKFPKLTHTRTDGYTNCLDAQTSYSFFKEWFRTFEQNPHVLECFKTTILKCLASEHIVDIEYKKEIEMDGKVLRLDDFILTKKNNGVEEHILMNNLSAGYKIVCSMVADMAYRCLQLNAPLNEHDNPIERTYGLVLIDELDMHLHPLWQRHIVNDLMHCFPKIQFISTTHSPFIVQSLKRSQIISLSPVEAINDADPINQNLEFVINEMGVESLHGEQYNTQKEIAEKFYELLQREDYTEEEFEQLYEQYQLKYCDDVLFIERMKQEKKWSL